MEFVCARVSQSGFAGLGSEAKIGPLASSYGDYRSETPGLWWAHNSGWSFSKSPNKRGQPGVWYTGYPKHSEEGEQGPAAVFILGATKANAHRACLTIPLWMGLKILSKVTTSRIATNMAYTSHRYNSPRHLCCHNRITLVATISNKKPMIHPDFQNYLHNDIGMVVVCMKQTNLQAVTDLDEHIPDQGPLGIDVIGS